MRVFICIELNREVQEEIKRLQNIISNKWKFTGNIAEPEQAHITLSFIGEVSEENVEKIKSKLNEMKLGGFSLRLAGAGVFRYNGKVKTVWVKAAGSGILKAQKQIKEALGEIIADERQFSPHISLARIKYISDSEGFVNYIKQMPVQHINFPVKRITLMQSILHPLGPEHIPIANYDLI